MIRMQKAGAALLLLAALFLPTPSATGIEAAIGNSDCSTVPPVPVFVLSDIEWEDEIQEGVTTVKYAPGFLEKFEIAENIVTGLFLKLLPGDQEKSITFSVASGETAVEISIELCDSGECLKRRFSYPREIDHCIKNYQAAQVLFAYSVESGGVSSDEPRLSSIVLTDPNSTYWFDKVMDK